MNLTIPGKTEAEVISVIDKVCKKSMYSCTIDGMEPDDIYQESFIICADAISRYNGKFPLENFLSYNLYRRLKTLYRDKSVGRIDTVCIDDLPDDFLSVMPKEHLKEFVTILNDSMSIDMRLDYIKYINKVSIPRVRRQKLLDEIRRIADDFFGW
jgi:DNA-directed RNA polymerase specialized sigma24 family protein